MSFCSIFWEFDLPFLPPSDHFFKIPLTNRTKKKKEIELLQYQVEGKIKYFVLCEIIQQKTLLIHGHKFGYKL